MTAYPVNTDRRNEPPRADSVTAKLRRVPGGRISSQEWCRRCLPYTYPLPESLVPSNGRPYRLAGDSSPGATRALRFPIQEQSCRTRSRKSLRNALVAAGRNERDERAECVRFSLLSTDKRFNHRRAGSQRQFRSGFACVSMPSTESERATPSPSLRRAAGRVKESLRHPSLR